MRAPDTGAGEPLRVVFDCNIYFQALISPTGPSGRCVDLAFQRRVTLVCSRYTVREFRETPEDRGLRARFPYGDADVAKLVENLERVALFLDDVPERFALPRDPDDAHYVNLALTAGASCIVSRDNDLLHLADRSRPEGREFHQRFPQLRILDPKQLLAEVSG